MHDRANISMVLYICIWTQIDLMTLTVTLYPDLSMFFTCHVRETIGLYYRTVIMFSCACYNIILLFYLINVTIIYKAMAVHTQISNGGKNAYIIYYYSHV